MVGPESVIEEAIVGAGAIVTADVAPRAKVRGSPAREAASALAEVAQLG